MAHIAITLKLFAAHYRQAPLQAAAILIGILLAVTLFVSVQAINLNAKRSYTQSTQPLSVSAKQLIIPLAGQTHLDEALYFQLRRQGITASLPVIEGQVRDEQGRRWKIQGTDLIAAISSRMRYAATANNSTFFSDALPLSRLLNAEPIVLLSQSAHTQFEPQNRLRLNGVDVQMVRLPDNWGLGSQLLMDISFAQQLLGKEKQLSYIALFDVTPDQLPWLQQLSAQAQWQHVAEKTDFSALTNSFHLNLTAMSLLAFLVGLFIAYNGVTYSLLKRNRLLVQIQQAGITRQHVFIALLIELALLVLIGTSLGFIAGIQLSHWLHPTVALTLEQLYGATLLPGTWQWSWWAQALTLTLVAAFFACWQHFKQYVARPLASQHGFYVAPISNNSHRLFYIALFLTGLSLLGLWLSEKHLFTMSWLGVFIFSIPLYLPKSLGFFAKISEKYAPDGLVQYLFAELKELIAPLSLAMMALLLATTANIGMNTLVGSFESTLTNWLNQRLHADIYITPSQGDMAQIAQHIGSIEGVEQVYQQYYLDDTLLGLPILLGTKDSATLEQSMQLKTQLPDFWPAFYGGNYVAISEPTALKLNLTLGSKLDLAQLKNNPLAHDPVQIGAIFYDYGAPKGELLLAPQLWFKHGFTTIPTSLGVKINQPAAAVYDRLITQFSLHTSQLLNQAEIKTIALTIFGQTFAVTHALNAVTLFVAMLGLVSACFMLIEARKAAIARLYALGVERNALLLMLICQMLSLVFFTLMIAIPLGAIAGYILTDIVTLRAFGWSLTYQWQWVSTFEIAGITLITASIATLLPLWRLARTPISNSLQQEVL